MTQLYDQHLAPTGLRSSQFGMLRRLRRVGPISINAFAENMVMDRTTMGRALQPLTRDGLIAVGPGPDKRTRALSLTEAGHARLAAALPHWERAQAAFEAAYGPGAAHALSVAMTRLAATEF